MDYKDYYFLIGRKDARGGLFGAFPTRSEATKHKTFLQPKWPGYLFTIMTRPEVEADHTISWSDTGYDKYFM